MCIYMITHFLFFYLYIFFFIIKFYFLVYFISNFLRKSPRIIFKIFTKLLLVTLLLARLLTYFTFHFLYIKKTRSDYREKSFFSFFFSIVRPFRTLTIYWSIIARQWIALALTKLAIMREECAFVLMQVRQLYRVGFFCGTRC